jgi:anaerobic selenocysteine-containing dehydrogenase
LTIDHQPLTIMKVHGACPHDCPDTCGVITEVVDGRAVNFYGDPDHPITQGWLCAKVRPYLDHVYHPDRLQYPLRRVGPKGSGGWARITWDEALAEIGARWRAIIAEHGAAAILPYSYSGTLGLAQMSVCNGRFWNRLGASRLERSICGAAAEFAVEATLGSAAQPALQRRGPQPSGHRLGAQSSDHRPPFHALSQGRAARRHAVGGH